MFFLFLKDRVATDKPELSENSPTANYTCEEHVKRVGGSGTSIITVILRFYTSDAPATI